jgi:hypothetical protein
LPVLNGPINGQVEASGFGRGVEADVLNKQMKERTEQAMLAGASTSRIE